VLEDVDVSINRWKFVPGKFAAVTLAVALAKHEDKPKAAEAGCTGIK
jgi:hypothetical protein